MNRPVAKAILQLCGKAIFFTALAGIVVGVIGYLNKWNTPLQYSNAFFVAACLVIIGCAASRLGAGQQWEALQRLNAYRAMSASDREDFIRNVSGSLGLVIVGILSAILLSLISWLVMKIF